MQKGFIYENKTIRVIYYYCVLIDLYVKYTRWYCRKLKSTKETCFYFYFFGWSHNLTIYFYSKFNPTQTIREHKKKTILNKLNWNWFSFFVFSSRKFYWSTRKKTDIKKGCRTKLHKEKKIYNKNIFQHHNKWIKSDIKILICQASTKKISIYNIVYKIKKKLFKAHHPVRFFNEQQ